MTEHELTDILERIRKDTKKKLEDLESRAQAFLWEREEMLKQVVIESNFVWCEKCNGTGAIERLDSGYMKRFGLREWDGCIACGGDGQEKRGCGFHK